VKEILKWPLIIAAVVVVLRVVVEQGGAPDAVAKPRMKGHVRTLPCSNSSRYTWC